MTVDEFLQRFEHTFAGRVLTALVRINVVDRALALSSRAFVVLVPMTILAGAVVRGESFGEILVERFNLTGAGAQAARTLFESPDAVRASVRGFGILFLVFGSVSLARGLERMYLDAWQMDDAPGSVQRRLAWIGGVVLFLAAAGPIRQLLDAAGLNVTLSIVNLALGTVVWLWTPYLLLGRRIPWRELLPTGVITAAFTTALGIASLVYMPVAVSMNATRYGYIGVAFAIVSWLFAYACTLIGAVVIGAVLMGRRPVAEDTPRWSPGSQAPPQAGD